jgi:hypothetical protein
MNGRHGVFETAREARIVSGSGGVTPGYPFGCHASNPKSTRAHEDTNQVHDPVLGDAPAGIPVSR